MATKRSITVVTASVNAAGMADFGLTTVEATREEIEIGRHYEMVEDIISEAGYDPPFLHFDADDAPGFLMAGVREYLREGAATEAPEADHVLP